MSVVKEIPQYQYLPSRDEWAPVASEAGSASVVPVPKTRRIPLRLTSMNVLFDRWEDGQPNKPDILCHPERYAKIFSEIFPGSKVADEPSVSVPPLHIMCFNEVTGRFVQNHLMKCPEIQKNGYVTSNIAGFKWFGNVLVASRPFSRLYQLDLSQSSGPRKPGVAGVFEVEVEDEAAPGGKRRRAVLAVCTIHLSSSSKDGPGRGKELKELYRIFREEPQFAAVENVAIMGDLNFHGEEENVNITDGFKDSYCLVHGMSPDGLGPKKPGLTFDSQVNFMHKLEWPHWGGGRFRLDRWLLNSRGKSRLEVKEMEVFANQPFSCTRGEDKVLVFPSDHFGLRGAGELVV